MKKKITGNIVDIEKKDIFWGEIDYDERILEIKKSGEQRPAQPFILPGFIDAHVHIESSMLIPSQFARLAVVHGTVGTVSDPHEIANVCGMEGVKYMLENGKTVPFKFHFGAPACVPATPYETAGSSLNADDVAKLLEEDDIFYLSEMMNFPGVLTGNEEVMKKIAAAAKLGKPVDGHAPGLRGKEAKAYAGAGISTDHECFTKEEAKDKLAAGMKILIREGSAAKNFDTLIDLLNDHEDEIMFCSDDKHPDSLVEGHIDVLCRRAVARGIDVFKVLKAACLNPTKHYRLKTGLLRMGDPADLIVVDSLQDFRVLQTVIDGRTVARNNKTLIESIPAPAINHFHTGKKLPRDFELPVANHPFPVIEVIDGELITNKQFDALPDNGRVYLADPSHDILKIAVVNRYADAPPAIAFVKNFGLKKGAIASSVAHDSHNIIAVGVDDESICQAVNAIIEQKGGISFADAGDPDADQILPLPIAGLMSAEDGYRVAKAYSAMDAAAKKAGSTLKSPYMTLSFMALLVIPKLKLSDLGLFDAESFSFVKT